MKKRNLAFFELRGLSRPKGICPFVSLLEGFKEGQILSQNRVGKPVFLIKILVCYMTGGSFSLLLPYVASSPNPLK